MIINSAPTIPSGVLLRPGTALKSTIRVNKIVGKDNSGLLSSDT
jgi:hypothetical protein